MISLRYLICSAQVLSTFPKFFKIKLFVLHHLGLATNEKRSMILLSWVSDPSRIRVRKCEVAGNIILVSCCWSWLCAFQEWLVFKSGFLLGHFCQFFRDLYFPPHMHVHTWPGQIYTLSSVNCFLPLYPLISQQSNSSFSVRNQFFAHTSSETMSRPQHCKAAASPYNGPYIPCTRIRNCHSAPLTAQDTYQALWGFPLKPFSLGLWWNAGTLLSLERDTNSIPTLLTK